MTIELPKDIELQLQGEARRHGMAPEAFVEKLIVDHLPTPAENATSLLKLFAEWEAEDAANPITPEQAEREFEEFKANMNRNRLESDGPNARIPFP